MSKDLNELLYGLGDNDVIPLPSGKTAVVREMTGHDQRGFMNRAKITNGTAVQDLLAACTLSINDAALPAEKETRTKFMLDLLASDRKAILFGIRRHSFGGEFRFSTQCPSCMTKETWEVDLSDKAKFPVTPAPNGDARESRYDSKIRKGLTIKYKLLDGNAEMAIIKKRDSVDLLTDLELRSPHALNLTDGKEIWIPVMLAKMPDSLISEMRQQVRANEGDIQSRVKVVCRSCQSEVEFDLLQVPDFMIPSVIS